MATTIQSGFRKRKPREDDSWDEDPKKRGRFEDPREIWPERPDGISEPQWWQIKPIYQVYPKSFCCAGRNGGVGNLKGEGDDVLLVIIQYYVLGTFCST